MKKNLFILMSALFLFGCSGSPDQTKESTSEESETVVEEKKLQDLENTTREIIDEAEDLAGEVDSLIQSL